MVLILDSEHPPSPVFNHVISTRYLYYSYAAYKLPAVGTWACPYCIGDTTGFHVTRNCRGSLNDSFAYIGYHMKNREVVVSFRGAANPSAWIEELLQPILVPPYYAFPGVQYAFVTSDFFLTYNDLKSCVLDAVVQLQSMNYMMVFVGHGLGAALAEIASLDLKVNNFPNGDIRVFTYGQPRVGNKAFADAVFKRIGTHNQRMVNYNDCVTKLPKHEIGYVHPPFEIFEYNSAENNYEVCDNSGEDPKCSVSTNFDCTSHFTYMGIQCCGHP